MSVHLKPLESQALRSQVANNLREAIYSGVFKPGDPVPEATIAAQLGVSRAPVREAILMLETEGFLVLKANRGAFVRTLTAQELAEMLTLRRALEAMALELARPRMTPELLAELRRLYESMLADARSGNVPGYTRTDRVFHHTFWEASGHRLLADTLSRVTNANFAFADVILTRARFDVTRLVELHEPILFYLAGDPNLTTAQVMDPLISYAFTDEWETLFGAKAEAPR